MCCTQNGDSFPIQKLLDYKVVEIIVNYHNDDLHVLGSSIDTDHTRYCIALLCCVVYKRDILDTQVHIPPLNIGTAAVSAGHITSA